MFCVIHRRPIPHALSILQTLVANKDIDSAEGRMLLDTQVRQIVRWHCRLSHVAAHTKMLTGIVHSVVTDNIDYYRFTYMHIYKNTHTFLFYNTTI
jgi:hypothetical protein